MKSENGTFFICGNSYTFAEFCEDYLDFPLNNDYRHYQILWDMYKNQYRKICKENEIIPETIY